jgi:DNA-binding response OmpR family regulator
VTARTSGGSDPGPHGAGPPGRRVLLLGVEGDTALVVRSLLTAAGAIVEGPVDPRDAAATPSLLQPAPATVLIDAESSRAAAVPVVELLRAIRGAGARTLIAVLAGPADLASALLEAGADEVLAGPMTLAALLEGLHLTDDETGAAQDELEAGVSGADHGPPMPGDWLPRLAGG